MNKQISNNRGNSSLFGILLAGAGVLFLLKQFKVIDLNFNHMSFFFIIAGIILGVQKGFSRPLPIILIIIGVAKVIPSFTLFGAQSNELFWPFLLVVGGIFIAIKPKKKQHHFVTGKSSFTEKSNPLDFENTTDENFVNIEAFFGGRKEIITSKQFSGCNATAVCGGVEINLMQADNIAQPMIIDLRVVFGGVEIIVPSHWEIINEVDVIFGGIEDKRNLRTASDVGETKKLLLRGSVTFGGLELKSY